MPECRIVDFQSESRLRARRARSLSSSLLKNGSASDLLCTGYGVYLIKRCIEGDTLCPGTTFTDLPGGWFIGSGILRQLPLPWAFWFLQ